VVGKGGWAGGWWGRSGMRSVGQKGLESQSLITKLGEGGDLQNGKWVFFARPKAPSKSHKT